MSRPFKKHPEYGGTVPHLSSCHSNCEDTMLKRKQHIVFSNSDDESPAASPAKKPAKKIKKPKVQDKETVKEEPKIRVPRPLKKVFKNILFAITTKNNDEDSVPDKDFNHDHLRQLIEARGGSVSPMLHKRVSVFLATEIAVTKNSQRIRKAVKYGVPVVKIEYLNACLEASMMLDVEDFAFDSDLFMKPNSKKVIKNVVHSPSKEFTKYAPRVIDLGCCCSCHDSGKSDCSWCAPLHHT